MKNMCKGRETDARSGLQEMTARQLAGITGGFAPMLLGIPVVLKAVYDLGKAVGREMYYIHNS